MTTRLCKYHGRSCEFPGACLNRAPKKYDTDGHLEAIDPERLTLGNVIRRVQEGGGMPAFSDNVIIGIKVQYGAAHRNAGKGEVEHFNTLADAQAAAWGNDYVILVLARPYLYASNPFGSIPNHLSGLEKYELFARKLDTHRVVVMSTGEYACFMSQPLLHKWEVLVNGDKVYDDLSEGGGRATYKLYRQMAQGAFGRKGGETVTLLCDGEKVEEYVP